jgi:hypothetical protein
VVVLQMAIILISRGDVYLLGEAYAFGVIWSFVFNSSSMLVLRFKYKGERGWKVPPNITIAGVEIPIGLASVCMVLIATAVVNLFTKSVATVSGIIFTVVVFVVFTVSERINRKKFSQAERQMKEQFQLLHRDTVDRESVGVRPGSIIVTVRDYNTMNHLRWAVERVDTKDQDIVVMTSRLTGMSAAGFDLAMEQIFSDYEQTLFTRAVAIAEKYGKHIWLLVVPARDVWSAIAQAANSLESSAVVAGLSTKMTAQEQAFKLGQAWEAMPEPKRQFVLQVVRPDMEVETFTIGPHTPSFKTEDVHLIHRLWLNITQERGLDRLHHSDIVTLALTRFARDYAGREHDDIVRELRKVEDRNTPHLPLRGDGSRPPQLSPDQRATHPERKEPPSPPVVEP